VSIIERVKQIVGKQSRHTSPGTQLLEDAAGLVFTTLSGILCPPASRTQQAEIDRHRPENWERNFR